MNKNIEVEGGEIAIRNSNGDLAIIPKNKVNWVKQKLSDGCHGCIDSLVETLPIASQYAQDGSVYPPNTKVKVSQDNQIKEYDISSSEYKDLYNSGKLVSYDKNTDTYIAAKPLEEVNVTAEAPQWLKDKRNLEEQYTKDWYIDNNMPKFSRSMGVSADNMHSNNVKQYNEFINNKLAESILKRNPKVGSSNNERLAWYNSLSEKERDIVNNSFSADKFSPAVRAYMESQSNEAKKYGILETFRDVDKLAQSVEGTPERFRIFPNAENNFENYVNPLMWIGDMAKGLGNVPKNIKEENYLKATISTASPLLGGALGGLGTKTTGQFIKNIFLPLGGAEENIIKGGKNLVNNGLVGKLSKADKVIDATKILNKIDNNSFYRQIGKEGYEDAIKTGVIRSKPIGEYAGKAPYFVEGKDFDKLYSTGAGAYGKKPEYIFEMPQLKNPEEMSAFRVSQQEGYAPYVAGSKEIPISQGKIYRLNNKNEYELVDATKAGSKVLGKEKGLNKIDNILQESNQLPEPPHEIILDQPSNYIETVNLERQGVKNKKIMPSFDDVDLGNDLILRNNPSRVVNKEDILGKNRSLISVKNKNNSEYIDLKSWKDNDGQIYYYMSANMPSSKIKAGKAYLELEKHIPKGASLLENSSLSYDSLLNILKQTKNPKFETFIKGRIPMNDMSVSNKLKSIGDKSSDSVDLGFYSKDIADNAVIELNELLNKYNLPEATVVKRTTSYQPQAHLPYEKKDIFEIELPNIGLKKLYSIIGLTSAGAAIQSQQQNKTEQ